MYANMDPNTIFEHSSCTVMETYGNILSLYSKINCVLNCKLSCMLDWRMSTIQSIPLQIQFLHRPEKWIDPTWSHTKPGVLAGSSKNSYGIHSNALLCRHATSWHRGPSFCRGDLGTWERKLPTAAPTMISRSALQSVSLSIIPYMKS